MSKVKVTAMICANENIHSEQTRMICRSSVPPKIIKVTLKVTINSDSHLKANPHSQGHHVRVNAAARSI